MNGYPWPEAYTTGTEPFYLSRCQVPLTNAGSQILCEVSSRVPSSTESSVRDALCDALERQRQR